MNIIKILLYLISLLEQSGRLIQVKIVDRAHLDLKVKGDRECLINRGECVIQIKITGTTYRARKKF